MNVCLWFGICLVFTANSISTAQADNRADALLQEAETAYKAIQTLSGTLTVRVVGNKQHVSSGTARLELKKPRLAHILFLSDKETWAGRTKAHNIAGNIILSDGKYVWDYDKRTNIYSRSALRSESSPMDLTGLIGYSDIVSLFYYSDGLSKLPFLDPMRQGFGDKVVTTKHYLGSKTVEGIDYEVVEVTMKAFVEPQAEPFVYSLDFYIGQDKLIHRTTSLVQMPKMPSGDSSTQTREEVLTDLQVNKSIPDSEFIFAPPLRATLKNK